MNVGEKIKEIRKSKGLTQKEFGELFDPTVTKWTVSVWERNVGKPGPRHKKKILDITGVSYSDFFGSDYIGNKYGELTVIDDLGTTLIRGNRIRKLTCRCSCGDISDYIASHLTSKNTTSCGHVRAKVLDDLLKKDTVEIGTRLSCISPNIKMNKNNKSGVKGVSWSKKTKKWEAHIKFKKKKIHLGLYEHKQDAIKARKLAEEKYFEPVLEKHKDVFEQ